MIPDLYSIPGPWRGLLAISSRPRGGDWLEDEVRGWRERGIDAVVSLLEKEEEKQLNLSDEKRLVESGGIRFISFPIPDRSVPASVPSTVSMLRLVNQALERGKNVAIHCRQGIGRSALVAAGALMAAGSSPQDALAAVRTARGLAVPETEEQREWLTRDLADSLAVVHR